MSARTLLIVDDHPLFREGMKHLVSGHNGFEIIGEAGSGQEALDCINQCKPDLVIMDICLPDKSGILVTREISKHHPEVKVIIVSMHSRIEHITEAFRSGVKGYVLKESITDRLIQGMEAVCNGEFFFDSKVSHKVLQRLVDVPQEEPNIVDNHYQKLTKREKQVLRFLAEGLSAKEVSERLYISPKTAENHRSNIMKKLNLHSTADLIRYAVKLGLVNTQEWEDEF